MTNVQDGRAAGETILLVEDGDPVRQLMRRMLEAHGYRVLEARNGDEATALAEAPRAPIDLLLTDVAMPGISGFDVVDRVMGSHPETKVLFITGQANHVVVRRGLNESRRPFLLKPYTHVDLVLKICEVLESNGEELRRSRSALPHRSRKGPQANLDAHE